MRRVSSGERRQVVDVLQALAGRLEQDRELGILAGDLEQLRGTLPLLPERRPGAGVAAGQEQGAGGALAEPGREQGRPADLGGDDLVELAGLEDEQLGPRRLAAGVGQPGDDAVVGGDHRPVDAEPLEDARAHRERPRGVDAPPVRRQQHHAPVAELVAEALDDEGAVGGHDAGGLALLEQERGEVGAGPGVEVAGLLALQVASDGVADGRAELVRTADGVALPERQPRGLAERRGDDHAVVGDLLDAPAGGAEREDVVDARLVDHLLVELADAPAAGAPARLVDALGEGDGEHAAVGDGAAAGDGQPLGAGPSGERAGVAVPDQPGTQLGELIRRVTPGQEVERGVERRSRHRRERRAATDEVEPLLDVERFEGGGRDRLLGEDVERVGRHDELLDETAAHALGRDGGTRPGRAGTWGRGCRARPRRPGARPGRRAAARWPPTGEWRSARPGRPRPCRCRARGWTWPRRSAAVRT